MECKYEGYLRRQEAEVLKFKKLEQISIPEDLSYAGIPGLSNEIKTETAGNQAAFFRPGFQNSWNDSGSPVDSIGLFEKTGEKPSHADENHRSGIQLVITMKSALP